MLRALWLQAVSVTRECRRFADVFQPEELFDHALHTQTETAMRWQAVFVHGQVVFKVSRIHMALFHFGDLLFIIMDALSAGGDLQSMQKQIIAERIARILRIIHCVERPFDRRIMGHKHQRRTGFREKMLSQPFFFLRRKVYRIGDLFAAGFGVERLGIGKTDLRDLYGIPCLTEAEESEDGGSSLTFEVSGMLAAVCLYPFPVPHGEAEENAAHNYLWPEAAESAARHRGQLLVTVLPREESVREAAILQVKLVCAACRQRGTLGVYANGTVYQPEFYLNASQPMEDGELPLLDLVWMGLYRREEGLCGYTDGLAAFGKEEIEVLDTQAAPGDLHSFLLDLASYVLEEDVTFHDGETIGFTEGQYLSISRSAGVWHDGMTLKIPYPEEP